MSIEGTVAIPVLIEYEQQILTPGIEAPAPPLEHIVDPEQALAAEQLFAQQQQESEMVIGLMGMYTGAMLLHDVAVETFSPKAGAIEEEEERKRKWLKENDEKCKL